MSYGSKNASKIALNYDDATTLASAKQYVNDNTNGFLKEDTLPIATESDIVSLFA